MLYTPPLLCCTDWILSLAEPWGFEQSADAIFPERIGSNTYGPMASANTAATAIIASVNVVVAVVVVVLLVF